MAKYCFGVDVGGTTVKLGCFDTEGTLLEKWEIHTRTENSGEAIRPDVADSILDKMKEREIAREDVVGVGIGAPGPIDGEGTVYNAVNLGWGTFSIKNRLQSLLNIPVEAGNDANVAALGEMWKGGGQGHKNLVAVTLGTGVGGGIIADGKILSGTTGAAGEIGHIHVMDGESERCNCGNYGCLEQYTSATGIVRLAKRRLEEAAEGYCGLGMTYYEQKQYDQALEMLEKAFDNGTVKTAKLCNLAGTSALCKEDYAKALEYIQEGIALAEEKQGNKKQEDKKQETLLQEMKYNEIICLEKTADWEMAKEKMSEYQAAYPEDESVAKEAEFLQTR